MTKPKLTELLKARVDPHTKRAFEQLTIALDHHDEADTTRAAYREFIERHRRLLPQQLQLTAR